MVAFLPEPTRRFLSLAGPAPDETQRAMEAHARERSFPIIGPAVGGLLTALAQLAGAERVFELGSGFGYSASWFARGMSGGEVVLTEVDVDELSQAEAFLTTAGYAPAFRYVHGDAIETLEDEAGPLDVVLFDHEKDRYVEAFERLRRKVAPGGVVVADNVMHGPASFEDVLAGLEGEPTPETSTAGVVAYLERVRDDPEFVSLVLPLGNGVAVSVKRR